MPTLKSRLELELGSAFEEAHLPAAHAVVTKYQRGDGAFDFQCNAALPLAGMLGRSPMVIASSLRDHLLDSQIFADVSVASPGYLNLRLSDGFIIDLIEEQEKAPQFGCSTDTPQSIMIDFGGPNIAKPLHVGHLRSLVIGESLRRILSFVGHSVKSDAHLGDWGLQFGMLLSEIELRFPDLPYFSGEAVSEPFDDYLFIDLLEAIYPQAAAACKKDPLRLEKARQATFQLQNGHHGYQALWRRLRDLSLADILPTMARLGASFDYLLGESDAQPTIDKIIDDLLDAGIAVLSEGAVVVPLENNLPPLLLRKSDGSSLYGSTDLATLHDRVTLMAAERVIYVVDHRQKTHFDQIFAAADRIGLNVKLDLASFGTVNGPNKKPLKTRDGGNTRLTDLLDEAREMALDRIAAKGNASTDDADLIGLAAVKFADLETPRLTGYVFDLTKMVAAQGRTGPYLLYTATRLRSLLQKADTSAIDGVPIRGLAPPYHLHTLERTALLQIVGFSDAVARAVDSLEPYELANFAYDLAKSLNAIYADLPVSSETDNEIRKRRVKIIELCLNRLVTTLNLIGLECPNAM